MATINKLDLGAVSAYALAVEQGYTGTEEEFATLMAQSGENAQAAEASKEGAEAWAVGQRNGEDVPDTDPTYQNNAKYYAEQAGDANTAAQGAKEAAQEAAASASAAYGTALLAPNYSSESTYKVGDHVIYSGNYYVCNTAITTAEAWTAAHWTQVTVGGESADVKSAFDEQNAWNENHFYSSEKTIYKYEDAGISWASGGLNPNNGSIQTNTSRIRTSAFVPVLVGRILKITVTNTFKFKVFYYSSDSASSFQRCDQNWSHESQIVENDTNTTFYIKIVAGYDDDSTISTVSTAAVNMGVFRAIPNVAVKADVETLIELHDSYTTNHYWNIETEKAVKTYLSSSWVAFDPIYVKPGQRYVVTSRQGNTDKTRIWVVVSEDYTILSMANNHKSSSTGTYTEEFTIPENGKYLLCTSYYSVNCKIKKYFTTLEYVTSKLLENKTVAIIGDSISTNGNTGTDSNVPEITVTDADVGVELSAYLTYYDVQAGLSLGGHTFTSEEIGTEVTFTPTDDDVGKSIGLPNNYNNNSVTTWWEVAQESLGFKTIPVCWSGSSITSHEAETENYAICAHAWHPSQIRKCGIRIPGTMTRTAPDMIIIYRGTNDFSHTPYTLLTGGYFDGYDWNYPVTDVVTGGYGYLEGLALTIKELRNAYPNAKIFLCTLNVFKRVSYAHFPTNNGINSLPEYNNAIRKAADFFGCGLIEFDKDGITFENCYSEGYITDSATIPTHPTDKGHYVMGQRAIADITAKYNALN